MKNPDDNLITETRAQRSLRTTLHSMLIKFKIYEKVHQSIVSHYEQYDKRVKDAFLSCYPEPSCFPTQAFINYYRKSSTIQSGMNEHRDRATFRSVVILLSEDDKDTSGPSLQIDDEYGKPITFKLSRGDLLMFSRCNHGVPGKHRSQPRATLVTGFVFHTGPHRSTPSHTGPPGRFVGVARCGAVWTGVDRCGAVWKSHQSTPVHTAPPQPTSSHTSPFSLLPGFNIKFALSFSFLREF
eukprot:scaffold3463_cov266-Ochromonas_danica.AAC.5